MILQCIEIGTNEMFYTESIKKHFNLIKVMVILVSIVGMGPRGPWFNSCYQSTS